MKFGLNSIFIYLLFFTLANGSVTVDINTRCTCDEVTGQFECMALQECKFQDNKCSQMTCSEAKSYNACQSIEKCAWYKLSCQEFTACDKYEVSTLEECFQLHSNCIFTPVVNTCTASPSVTKKCSELTENNCFKGTDGVCVVADNKCKLWTNCEEADKYKCPEGMEKCKWDDKTEKCLPTPTCKDIGDGFCMFAYTSLTGSEAYICSENLADESCQDFNSAETTKDTCSILSYGYFKWKNGSCKKCDGNKDNYGIIISQIVIVMISIFI